jgi:hypothetical protein
MAFINQLQNTSSIPKEAHIHQQHPYPSSSQALGTADYFLCLD